MTCKTNFCRQCILKIKPYVPGKPIEEVKRELGIDDVIKLASNENPLGPSPKAITAMQDAIKDCALYPDGSCYELRNVLAKHLNVDPSMLIFGAGGDEIIFYLAMAFLCEGDETVQSDVTFLEYETVATLMNCNAKMVSLNNFNQDVDALISQINNKTKIVTVTNPNNPTGTLVSSEDIQRLLNAMPEGCILFLDEAYYEYVDDPKYSKGIEWAKQGKNIVVLRTFSKIYGMAGLRIGYAIAPKEIIDILERVRAPFNVNSVAQIGAIASLNDQDQVKRSREQNAASKEYFYKELTRLGITYTPSQANFVWMDVNKDCKHVFTELLKRGVIVRTGDIFNTPTHIRVTTGTPEQSKKFISALEEVLAL